VCLPPPFFEGGGFFSPPQGGGFFFPPAGEIPPPPGGGSPRGGLCSFCEKRVCFFKTFPNFFFERVSPGGANLPFVKNGRFFLNPPWGVFPQIFGGALLKNFFPPPGGNPQIFGGGLFPN